MTSLVNILHKAQYDGRRRVFKSLLRLRQRASLYTYVVKERPLLLKARRAYDELYKSEVNPLVSVTIATYNRAQLLVERAISSAQNQTYQNLEIIVVGDGCTDDTGERLSALGDPRIRFINLPQRGNYPKNPKHRWMVAGTYPINRAQAEARGSWIAHLDDDAIWRKDHIKTMLEASETLSSELGFASGRIEVTSGTWKAIGSPIQNGYCALDTTFPHSSWFFRTYMKLFRFSPCSWQIGLATDRHVSTRMILAKANIGFVDAIAYDEPLRPTARVQGSQAQDRF